jgi:protein-S-isoprenylcysteine O-methyltransferase Ste14
MFDKDSIDIFLNKVPDLRNPLKAFLTVVYVFFVALMCIIFFRTLNSLGLIAPIISQFVMALVVLIIAYLHFIKAPEYRVQYGALAYRFYFYRYMIPYLVTWYACFFHPLFVDGPKLLPNWLAITLGVLFLVLMFLTSIHIERAGFHTLTHGMDIYSVYPEEATVVRGEIYGYIRHPLYFALLCGGIGLAFFSNNWVALIVALLQLIPALGVGYMEDRELTLGEGERHRAYIKATSALLPFKNPVGFLNLLFFQDG